METKTCPKCEARWIDGKHYWLTGKPGNEADLAGLVCDKLGDETCINPMRGCKHGGDTWEKRFTDIDELEKRMREE
jgi:hypothetical protein